MILKTGVNVKHLILASLIGFSGGAFANVLCGGFYDQETYVSVSIATQGVTARPTSGEVIIETGGNRYGYRFGADKINQYFEHSRSSDNSMTAGLFASPPLMARSNSATSAQTTSTWT